jgi:hypothetical protein
MDNYITSAFEIECKNHWETPLDYLHSSPNICVCFFFYGESIKKGVIDGACTVHE